MPLTSDDLSLARIVAQRLVHPLNDAAAVVEHLGCVQAQDLPGSLLSIALRNRSRSLEEVVARFDDATLVRNWTQRGTLHIVRAADQGWMLALTGPRMESGSAQRHRRLGIDEELLGRARDLAETMLHKVGRASRAELFSAWDQAGLVEGVAQRAVHLLSLLCRRGVLALGPLRATSTGWEQLVVPAPAWVGVGTQLDEDEALARWARTYFTSHGPAGEADLARWTGLGLTRVRRGIAENPDLARVEVDGEVLLMAPDLLDRLAALRAEAAEVLLLPGFDELVLGYRDRTPTVPAEFAEAIVPGNNGMFRSTVVADGRVVGTWRRAPRRSGRPGVPVVEWLVEPDDRLLVGLAKATAQLPAAGTKAA